MRHLRCFIASALLLGCAVVVCSCDEHSSAAPPSPVPRPKAALPSASSPKPIAPPAPRDTPEPDLLAVSELPDEAPAASASGEAALPPSKLIIDRAQEIGPAGQMTATDHGVVMINRSDELQLAKAALLSHSVRPEQAQFSRVKGGANDFFAVARGPLVQRNKAYWVREG